MCQLNFVHCRITIQRQLYGTHADDITDHASLLEVLHVAIVSYMGPDGATEVMEVFGLPYTLEFQVTQK